MSQCVQGNPEKVDYDIANSFRQAMSPMYKSSLASFVRLFQACLSEERHQPGSPARRSSRGNSASESASAVGDRLARLTPALQVRPSRCHLFPLSSLSSLLSSWDFLLIAIFRVQQRWCKTETDWYTIF